MEFDAKKRPKAYFLKESHHATGSTLLFFENCVEQIDKLLLLFVFRLF